MTGDSNFLSLFCFTFLTLHSPVIQPPFLPSSGICVQKLYFWPKFFEIPPYGKIVIFITEFVILEKISLAPYEIPETKDQKVEIWA